MINRPKCDKHPTYKAKRQPRSSCDRCWISWLVMENWRLEQRVKALEEKPPPQYFDPVVWFGR